jgi:lipopolysaccharide transport system permease protein
VLARRALTVRYRQTLLGAAWALLEPVLMMIVFTVFFGLLGRFPSDGIPYPVFYLSALVVWESIAGVVSAGSSSVIANAPLVNRVYFPRSYLPLSTALSNLVDLGAGLVALAVLLAFEGMVPGWQLILAPVAVAIGFVTALGVAFWFSAINVVYRDVRMLLPVLVRLWFFCTPILYPVSLIPPEYQGLYYLNPAAVAISGFRWAVTGTPPPPPEAWVVGVLISTVILVSGYLFFRRREPTFSDTV